MQTAQTHSTVWANDTGTARSAPGVGVIALVADEWKSVWMPRHQILSRLAGSFDVVWVNPAGNWREHWLPGRSRFLEPHRFAEVAPGLSVMTSGAAGRRSSALRGCKVG